MRRENESFGSVPDAVSHALETELRMSMRDVTEHERETEKGEARTPVDLACGYRNFVQNGRPSHHWKQAFELRWDALDRAIGPKDAEAAK